jgi:hypothetical protein
MRTLLLIVFLTTLTIYSSGQKKAIEKKKVVAERKPDVVTQFKNLVTLIDNRFKKTPAVLTYQDFSTSPSGLIFYKLQFEELESSYDVQATNSLVTPYTGFIVLKLKVKTNAKSGDVKSIDYNVGFSDSTKAKQNDNYETCTDPKYDLNQWCVGEIKILYAYQNSKWIFKSIDTEVSNKIGNGTTRGDIQRGVLDKLLTE